MAETYHERMRRRAARLVLENHLAPAQAAKILNCTVQGVRRWVEEHLDQESPPSPPLPSTFVPVVIEESDSLEISVSEPISLDILTKSGLTLRLSLSSLDLLPQLLKTLETPTC